MIRSVGEVALQKDGTAPEYRDTIGSMLEEVNRLTCLVDSLLTISRGDSGHLQLHRTVFPAMALAREAAGLFEVLTEERAQQLIVEGDADVLLEGDRLFLRQALVNIVHNAIKYSPEGGTITVAVLSEVSGVVLEVSDRGPGIPERDQARVFDRFYRVDKARSSESGGAGLGLSIAKWAAEAHGGRITLSSEANRGCTFRISLPAANRPAESLPARATA
jgi:signal transduction histidine kinase